MQMKVPDGTPAGARVSCPGCKTHLAVPAPALAAAVPAAPLPAPPAGDGVRPVHLAQTKAKDSFDDPENVRDLSRAAPPPPSGEADWRPAATALYLMGTAARVFAVLLLASLLYNLLILAIARSITLETAETIDTLFNGLYGLLLATCLGLVLFARAVYSRLSVSCGGGSLAKVALLLTPIQFLALIGAVLLAVLDPDSKGFVGLLGVVWLLLYLTTEIVFLLSLGGAVKRLSRDGVSAATIVFWVAFGLGFAAIVAVWVLNSPDPRSRHDDAPVYNLLATKVVMLLVWLLYWNILSVAGGIVRKELKRVKSLTGSEVSE